MKKMILREEYDLYFATLNFKRSVYVSGSAFAHANVLYMHIIANSKSTAHTQLVKHCVDTLEARPSGIQLKRIPEDELGFAINPDLVMGLERGIQPLIPAASLS